MQGWDNGDSSLVQSLAQLDTDTVAAQTRASLPKLSHQCPILVGKVLRQVKMV